jgi:hypothetical protein
MKLPAMRSVKETTTFISQQLELIICGLSITKMIHYQGNTITDMLNKNRMPKVKYQHRIPEFI